MQKKHWRLSLLALALGSCCKGWAVTTSLSSFNTTSTGQFSIQYTNNDPQKYNGICFLRSLSSYNQYIFTTEASPKIPSGYWYADRVRWLKISSNGTIDNTNDSHQDISTLNLQNNQYISDLCFLGNQGYLAISTGEIYRFSVDIKKGSPLTVDNIPIQIVSDQEVTLASLNLGEISKLYIGSHDGTTNKLKRYSINQMDYSLKSDQYLVKLLDHQGNGFIPYSIKPYGQNFYMSGYTFSTSNNWVLQFPLNETGDFLNSSGDVVNSDEGIKGKLVISSQSTPFYGMSLFTNRLYLNTTEKSTIVSGDIKGFYLDYLEEDLKPLYDITTCVGASLIIGNDSLAPGKYSLKGIGKATGVISFEVQRPKLCFVGFEDSASQPPSITVAPGESKTIEVFDKNDSSKTTLLSGNITGGSLDVKDLKIIVFGNQNKTLSEIDQQTLSSGDYVITGTNSGVTGFVSFTVDLQKAKLSGLSTALKPGETRTVHLLDPSNNPITFFDSSDNEVTSITISAEKYDISKNADLLGLASQELEPGSYSISGQDVDGSKGKITLVVKQPVRIPYDITTLEGASEILSHSGSLPPKTYTLKPKSEDASMAIGTLTFTVPSPAVYDITTAQGFNDIQNKKLLPGNYSVTLDPSSGGTGVITFNVPKPLLSTSGDLVPGESVTIKALMDGKEVNSETIVRVKDVKVFVDQSQSLFLNPGETRTIALATTDDSWIGSQPYHSLDLKAKEVMGTITGQTILTEGQSSTVKIDTTDNLWSGDQAQVSVENGQAKITPVDCSIF